MATPDAPHDLFVEQPEADLPDYALPPEEEVGAIHTVPWVAIALAVHIVMLVIAWFIIPQFPAGHQDRLIVVSDEKVVDVPPPVQRPEVLTDFPTEEVESEPVEDNRIPTEESDHPEDPTDSPKRDLADNPNPEESPAESPHPNRDNPSSSVGLKGSPSGGGGPGGDGGNFHHRPGPGGGVDIPHKEHLEGALKWLKDHQNREGYWSATTFGEDSRRDGAEHTYNIEFVNVGKQNGDAGWEATCDVGLTGLAMLAFTGVGYDHKAPEYGGVLRQALLYMMRVQDNDGCFGDKADDHFIYNHAIATMAMAELYGISGDQKLKPICDRAVEFILKAQNPGMGWRYDVRPGINDSSVTGWMVLTLHTCELAGLHFDTSKCYRHAAKWFETVTIEVNGYLKCGYDSPGSDNARLRSAAHYDANPSMDAIYVMSMLFMGESELRDRDIKELSKVCIEPDFLPRWEENKIDYYYWYYASLALYQVGGREWAAWENAIIKTLLDNQRGFHTLDEAKGLTSAELLDEHGSWDPVGAWGSAGGRVYATAINALTIQTYHRHKRMNESD